MAAPVPYIPPSLCTGSWRLGDDNPCAAQDGKTAESYAAEALEISGATINVFKLLGVAEQGQLIDLTGSGFPISSGTAAGYNVSNAFDITSNTWQSSQVGPAVTSAPAYIGYNFGTKKTSFGAEKYGAPAPVMQHITTIKIQQGSLSTNRASQIRVDRSTGKTTLSTPSFFGVGNGQIVEVTPGFSSVPATIMISATSPTTFDVVSSVFGLLGAASVGIKFNSPQLSFIIQAGTTPFIPSDTFIIESHLTWLRVDVVNVPNTSVLETISVKPSAPSPYWRIVPLIFNGAATDAWEIDKLEFMDYQQTSIDNIQDTLFLENRDRDYAQLSIPIKCSYSPFDAIGDLGKFGLSILDQYIFTCSFAKMVEMLGRPIVVGDVLEVTPELAYDHNLRPVKKFLEVTEAGWAAEGFTPGWRPILYRFQAQQLMPSAETRSLFGTPDSRQFKVDDSTFFENLTSIETTPLKVSQDIGQQSIDAVPERGQDPQEIASGTPSIITSTPRGIGEYDGRDPYIEDGLPPDGLPYGEGYKMPDNLSATDGEYFRLNYPADLQIPPRLYRFSIYKNKWIFIETDRRNEYVSHKPSIKKMLQSSTSKSIKSSI